MSVWGVALVKDEGDVIADTVGRMLAQVDHVLIADNGSSDGTGEIARELGAEVFEDTTAGYYQSEKTSALAARALQGGAEWVVPFDADEVHLCKGGIGRGLMGLPPEVLVSEASLIDHVATGLDNIGEQSPVKRLEWRRAAQAPLRKVACRARKGLVIHQGNHGASYPGVPHPPTVTNLASVRHFPYRSIEQFERKVRNGAAAYAATDLPEDAGAHWRAYGRILDEDGPEALAGVFRTWFYRDDPEVGITIQGESQPALLHDPCP